MRLRGLALAAVAGPAVALVLADLPPLRIAVNGPAAAPAAASTADLAPSPGESNVEDPSPAVVVTEQAAEPADPLSGSELEPPAPVPAPAKEAAVPEAPAAAATKPGPRPYAIDMPILIYHAIRPGPPPASQMARWLTVSPEAFDQQLRFLRDNGYRSISFARLADFLERGTALPERPVIISFDDGWENQFVYAYPLLSQYGFGATFFVVTNYLDRPNFMTIEQLHTMIAGGMEIGSHTRSHPALTAIGNPRRLKDEIAGSKAFLEERLGIPVDTFAYPYGAYNGTVAAAVKAAGYRSARTVAAGTHDTAADLETLPGLTFPVYLNHYREQVELISGESGR